MKLLPVTTLVVRNWYCGALFSRPTDVIGNISHVTRPHYQLVTTNSMLWRRAPPQIAASLLRYLMFIIKGTTHLTELIPAHNNLSITTTMIHTCWNTLIKISILIILTQYIKIFFLILINYQLYSETGMYTRRLRVQLYSYEVKECTKYLRN